jgi:predicted transcriptional regulator
MSGRTKPKRIRQIAATIQLPKDLAEPLERFAEQTGMKKTAIAQAALRSTLPGLLAGELAVVNGEIRPTPRAA